MSLLKVDRGREGRRWGERERKRNKRQREGKPITNYADHYNQLGYSHKREIPSISHAQENIIIHYRMSNVLLKHVRL